MNTEFGSNLVNCRIENLHSFHEGIRNKRKLALVVDSQLEA